MFTTLTAMDGFDPVGENGAYPSDGMQEGFSKLLKQETWKNSFSVSREMIEDSKLMDLRGEPAGFMKAYHRTRERFAACLYGHAVRGEGTAKFRGKDFDVRGADGLTLFHGAHPAKVKGAKQSNRFNNAFSEDALGRMETVMQNFKGDNGELLDVAPTTIAIPNDHALKKAVFAAIGADKDPVTSGNAFNYQYGRWTVIVWNYLNEFVSGATLPWLLLDTSYSDEYGGAVWLDRIELDVRSTLDENTDANVWRGRSRFNASFNDWRFAAVGGVSGADALPA
jgi:hypothetical protein